MPQVDITLAEGRSPNQIRNLMRDVHSAVLRTTDTRPEYVRVVVHEVPRTHWSTGGTTIAEMDSRHQGPAEDDSTTDGPRPTVEDQEQS